MPDVHDFELFHGIALTKLVRSDRPVALRMIETRPSDSWSTYVVNDSVAMLVKHSTKPIPLKRSQGGVAWTFVFPSEQVREISALETKREVYLALVCGARKLGAAKMQVCLLRPNEVAQLLRMSANGSVQSVRVKYSPGKQLRVSSPRLRESSEGVTELVVPRNRLEQWQVPGS